MSTETAAPIQPYLNPAYWNGNTLQDGLAERPDIDHISRSMRAFAVDSLASTLATADRSFALSVYRHGSRFIAAEREAGTIIFMNQEKLFQERSDVPLEPMETFADLGVPVVPTTVDLNYADPALARFGTQYRVGNGYVYASTTRCGVVVPVKKGEHTLVSVAGGGIRHGANPEEVKDWTISENFLHEGTELAVGRVVHTSRTRKEPECLKRINVVEVRGLGKPEKVYKPLKERAKDHIRGRFHAPKPIILEPFSE